MKMPTDGGKECAAGGQRGWLVTALLLVAVLAGGCAAAGNTGRQEGAAAIAEAASAAWKTLPGDEALKAAYQPYLSDPGNIDLTADAQNKLAAFAVGDVLSASLINPEKKVVLSTEADRVGTSVWDSRVNRRVRADSTDFGVLGWKDDQPVLIAERRVPAAQNLSGFFEMTRALPEIEKEIAAQNAKGYTVVLIGNDNQSILWDGKTEPMLENTSDRINGLEDLNDHAYRGDLSESTGKIRFRVGKNAYAGVYQEVDGLGWIVVVGR